MTSLPPRPTADPSERRTVTLDAVFSILGDRDRRRLVSELVETDSLSVEEFARSADRDEFRVDDTRLYHVHLPKLHDAGVCNWDRDAGAVRRGPCFDDVAVVVEVLRANGDALPGGWP